MRIFVGGVHGAGKSTLCSVYASLYPDWTYKSASTLITEALGRRNWTANKRVGDVESNQQALVDALSDPKYKEKLILSGHFALLNKQGRCVSVATDVFACLNLTAVILLDAIPELVLPRLRSQGLEITLEEIKTLAHEEKAKAQLVCSRLDLPLKILQHPSLHKFEQAVSSLVS